MTLPPHFNTLKSGFQDLPEVEQEDFFALTCFDLGHWEESPAWKVDYNQVDRELTEYFRKIFSQTEWNKIESRDGGADWLLNRCRDGKITNFLLAWYLEQHSTYACRTESKNNNSEYDVTMVEDGVPLCGLEIKRLASTRQIAENLEQHQEDSHNRENVRNTVLVNYFPITDASKSRRVRDFVSGYDHLPSEVHEFYKGEENYVVNLPAPVSPTKRDITPLEGTYQVLRQKIGFDGMIRR